MKKRFLVNISVVAILAFFISSCLDDENEVVTQTLEQEKTILANYLDSLVAKGYDVDTTDLGIYYVTMTAGEGDFPKAGDTLEVTYTGYFMNGDIFDSSSLLNEDGIWTFELGNPAMIEGWDDGMTVINQGAVVELIIPSEFAYGSTGYGAITGNQSLVFVVEMKAIKPS